MHSRHPDTTCPLRLQPASHSRTSSCGWLPPNRSKSRLNQRLYAFSREARALTHKIWQVQWTDKWHNVIPKVWFSPHQISWSTVCHEISFSETLKLTWNLTVFNPDTAGLYVVIVLCVQNSHLISLLKQNKTTHSFLTCWNSSPWHFPTGSLWYWLQRAPWCWPSHSGCPGWPLFDPCGSRLHSNCQSNHQHFPPLCWGCVLLLLLKLYLNANISKKLVWLLISLSLESVVIFR